MSEHVFGKPLTRKFIAYENDTPIPLSSLSSVTLYSSMSDAVAASNPIASMSSWTALSQSPYAVNYNLPSISDPNPSSERKTWQLWESIKYKLDSGADEQTDYRAIEISRAETGQSYPDTNKLDLIALFPALASYLSFDRMDDILDLARTQLKLDLKSLSIEYSRARNLTECKLALAYLGVAMAAEALYAKTGQDVHYNRGIMYRKMYGETKAKITLPYDTDGDGEVDTAKAAAPSFWYNPR